MLTSQESTSMQDQEKLLFLKVANVLIQNKRHQEIISLSWFAVQLLDKWLQPIIILKKNRPSGPYSRNGPGGCLYGKSTDRYMDEELFLTCFEEIFSLGTSHVQPTSLIIDDHGLHISYCIIKRAVEENIKLYFFHHTQQMPSNHWMLVYSDPWKQTC